MSHGGRNLSDVDLFRIVLQLQQEATRRGLRGFHGAGMESLHLVGLIPRAVLPVCVACGQSARLVGSELAAPTEAFDCGVCASASRASAEAAHRSAASAEAAVLAEVVSVEAAVGAVRAAAGAAAMPNGPFGAQGGVERVMGLLGLAGASECATMTVAGTMSYGELACVAGVVPGEVLSGIGGMPAVVGGGAACGEEVSAFPGVTSTVWRGSDADADAVIGGGGSVVWSGSEVEAAMGEGLAGVVWGEPDGMVGAVEGSVWADTEGVVGRGVGAV